MGDRVSNKLKRPEACERSEIKRVARIWLGRTAMKQAVIVSPLLEWSRLETSMNGSEVFLNDQCWQRCTFSSHFVSS